MSLHTPPPQHTPHYDTTHMLIGENIQTDWECEWDLMIQCDLNVSLFECDLITVRTQKFLQDIWLLLLSRCYFKRFCLAKMLVSF